MKLLFEQQVHVFPESTLVQPRWKKTLSEYQNNLCLNGQALSDKPLHFLFPLVSLQVLFFSYFESQCRI